MADANSRAAIATIRALDGYDLNLFISFNSISISNKIVFHRYLKHPPLNHCNKTKDDFISSLISIREKIGDYILLPYGEKLLRWAISEKDFLSLNGVIIPTVNLEKYELISDKESFANLCRKYSIDVPVNKKYDKTKFKNKFVIKPKKLLNDSHVLQNPILIENEKSFNNLNKMDLDLDMHFVQEYIDGPSIYYCAYYKCGKNELYFTQINYRQQPNGKSVIKAAPHELPSDIVSKIDDMFQAIGWDGVVMVEVKKDLISHKYYAIEANPRFWGPLQLSIDNGINFPAALLGFQIKNSTNEKNSGYIWFAGYIYSIVIKLNTNTDVQRFQNENKNKIHYKDVWLRYDTFLYFFLEIVISILSVIKNYMLHIFKKCVH
jgi:predicted ATP-grasp superfamily ATP-dependent carboligase